MHTRTTANRERMAILIAVRIPESPPSNSSALVLAECGCTEREGSGLVDR